MDRYLKKLKEKGTKSDNKTKHNDSIKRSDPDLCEKYLNLSICTRFTVNPDNEGLEKQK
ncbi:hypothetical protein LEP1GSC060_1838 [Leptospira weilii serovar Ranarum str. ICFT]|uniref:Uncharacterized protein n=1 Tax=Leptospira weilii serovar Ranarum str. ICFT TaxID=1218598 RepID=N1WLR6_9LEPT|nr:hypothetical protein LEP1GSC060_1838 [Leptospira weilii serovar Ranarum str. ICFT]